ncbi:hypothetical protein F511_30700 [Dorcoceras hygrometricum]|uniref:Uncharacterized protein n=1 Tax=Dorcoceras hygrometricum TaxID=472368 RepID=A0A2Z7BBM8_9LAMI|nr:hypothetical protein F511_30700 [Dorcoceras hygrometricum]
MRREVKEMKRRRAKVSADGLALMTSLVTSSQSADGLSLAVARTSSRKIQSRATVDPVARSSRKLHYYCISSRHGIQSQENRCNGELQSRRKIPVAVFEDSAEAQSSSRMNQRRSS